MVKNFTAEQSRAEQKRSGDIGNFSITVKNFKLHNDGNFILSLYSFEHVRLQSVN